MGICDLLAQHPNSQPNPLENKERRLWSIPIRCNSVATKKRQTRRFIQNIQKKNRKPSDFRLYLVEVAGFEPAAFWSRTKRATKLRYTSMLEPIRGLGPLTC